MSLYSVNLLRLFELVEMYETKVMGPKGRLRRILKKKDLKKLIKDLERF